MSAGVRYRPDIDGLRSVAVLPVVLFHAGVPMLSGGYVGVDIFFVISGYLITGILLKSLDNGRFSIIDFYKRRIRRIFPALLLVLSTSTIIAWVIFSPGSLIEYGGSMIFVSAFSSNFYFWKSVDYFSTNAHVQPLLHTWSLAVEEQFYIFYPLALYLLLKAKMKLWPTLLAAGVVSLALSIGFLSSAPGAVFYLLPARAWELIVGGLLACGVVRAPATVRSGIAGGLVGMALVLVPMVLYDNRTPFPGLAAVPPVVGAALLIWCGSTGSGPIYRFLSSWPMVLVGRASYSFYLWHYPIFAFAAYLHGGQFDLATGLFLSVVSLGLALLTLRLVETPVRISRSPLAVVIPLLGMVAAGVTGLALARSDGFPNRLSPQQRLIVATEGDKTRHPYECMSVGDTIRSVDTACLLGDRLASPETILWGDSHAMVTATAMATAATEQSASFLFVATADCPVGLGFGISEATEADLTTSAAYRHCRRYNAQMLERVLGDPSIRNVVLSSRWTNWRIGEPANPMELQHDIRLQDDADVARSGADNARIFKAGFTRLLDALVEAGKTVYIVGPLPEPSVAVPQSLFVAQFGFIDAPKPIPYAQYRARHRQILDYFASIERQYPVQFIWPERVLCDGQQCPLVDHGKPVFFDHNHLSVHAARKTAPLYAPIFEPATR